MERKLIEYLPFVVRNYDVFKAIAAGQQPEIESAWNSVDELLNDQFITASGELGLSRWESIFGIVPKGTDSIEDRRFRILTRINEERPYSLPQLRGILETLCGKGNATAEIADESYVLFVRVALTARSNYNDVAELLKKVVPENLIINLSLLYNQHSRYRSYTHAQLAKFTHDELRNKEFE